MPYIAEEERGELLQGITRLSNAITQQRTLSDQECAGRVNYAITTLLLQVFPKRKYWVMALVCGVIVTVLLEYYRRWCVPYEDKKIEENGDVY